MYKKLREGEAGFCRKSYSSVLKLKAGEIKKFLKKYSFVYPKSKMYKKLREREAGFCRNSSSRVL